MTEPIEVSALPELSGVTRAQFDAEIRPAGRPVILRGVAAHWPAVAAGRGSAQAMADYLGGYASDQPASTIVAPPETRGRYFYRPDLKGFNFDRRQIPMKQALAKLLEIAEDPAPMGIYAGATRSSDIFPGFSTANDMPLLDDSVQPLIWVGNSARIAPHYDASENIACAVCGPRQFLVFPPEQVENLYVGPLENTMAGQPASMVDPAAPDYARYPKFADAMAAAQLAVLAPGDGIYLPALWWHYVESAGPLNVLANYWWNEVSKGMGVASLAHAMLMLRDLPPAEKDAWHILFKHYVFGDAAASAVDHLPEHARGVLGAASPQRDAMIRDFIKSTLG